MAINPLGSPGIGLTPLFRCCLFAFVMDRGTPRQDKKRLHSATNVAGVERGTRLATSFGMAKAAF